MSISPFTGVGFGNGFGLGNIGPPSGGGQYVGLPSNRGLQAYAGGSGGVHPLLYTTLHF